MDNVDGKPKKSILEEPMKKKIDKIKLSVTKTDIKVANNRNLAHCILATAIRRHFKLPKSALVSVGYSTALISKSYTALISKCYYIEPSADISKYIHDWEDKKKIKPRSFTLVSKN